MQIVVLADSRQREEFFKNVSAGTSVIYINDEEDFLHYKAADAFFDLEFISDPQRINVLAALLPKPVFINCVVQTLVEINEDFIRINGWTSFLSATVIEATAAIPTLRSQAETIFAALDKKIAWLPDEPGFIAARVVSMIINEAFIALGEGVSTKDDINTAMKLGTAYPYGPFEWADKIGLQNIVTLLEKLSVKQIRYKPAGAMVQETNRAI